MVTLPTKRRATRSWPKPRLEDVHLSSYSRMQSEVRCRGTKWQNGVRESGHHLLEEGTDNFLPELPVATADGQSQNRHNHR